MGLGLGLAKLGFLGECPGRIGCGVGRGDFIAQEVVLIRSIKK